jgi:hypothetical protein
VTKRSPRIRSVFEKQTNCLSVIKTLLIFSSVEIFVTVYIKIEIDLEQDATLVFLFYCKITLHVSGNFRTHNQEYNKL